MRRLDEQQSVRLQKKEALERKGIDPYPARSARTHSIESALSEFEALSQEKKEVTIVGRVIQIRAHGGSTFLTLSDGDSAFQVYLKKNELGSDLYEQWIHTIDIGDFFDFFKNVKYFCRPAV